jgi:prepilin-type N-terminal cleavage/methylation domain-containing protein
MITSARKLGSSSAGRRSRRVARGFTLVEVLVALTAGLLVSASAYALARNAMKSFQDESRISGSQVSTALALGRITADIQRAGYMSSPDVAADPKRCASVDVTQVPLEAIQFRNGGSDIDGKVADKGYDLNPGIPVPDAVVITGNMTSTEQFEYRGIDADGKMWLAVNRGPTQRAYRDAGMNTTSFCEIFYPSAPPTSDTRRFVRVVEASGLETYFFVSECVATPTSTGDLETAYLQLEVPGSSGTPPDTSNSACGARPGGGLVNPVSIIRYRIGPLCDSFPCAGTPYAAVYAPTGPDATTGESWRVELLREEIGAENAGDVFAIDDNAGSLISQEVIAEFAVDLDFAAITLVAPNSNAPTTLALVNFNDGGSPIDAIAPNRVRSVRVRLGTRARVPDRDTDSPSDVVTRWLLKDVASANRYARMRTLHTEIQLPNLSQVSW